MPALPFCCSAFASPPPLAYGSYEPPGGKRCKESNAPRMSLRLTYFSLLFFLRGSHAGGYTALVSQHIVFIGKEGPQEPEKSSKKV